MEKDSHPPAGLPSSNAYPPQAYPPPQQVGYPAPPPAGYPTGSAIQQGYQPLIQGPPQPETQQPGFPPQQYGSFQQQPGKCTVWTICGIVICARICVAAVKWDKFLFQRYLV